MLNYILRRILYAVPILIGVSLVTFLLFYATASPEQAQRVYQDLLHGRWSHLAAVFRWACGSASASSPLCSPEARASWPSTRTSGVACSGASRPAASPARRKLCRRRGRL